MRGNCSSKQLSPRTSQLHPPWGKGNLIPGFPWGETNSLFLRERQFTPLFHRENKQLNLLLPKESPFLSQASSLKKLPRDCFCNHFVHGRRQDLREKSNLEPLVERGDYNHWIIFFPGKYCVRKKKC